MRGKDWMRPSMEDMPILSTHSSCTQSPLVRLRKILKGDRENEFWRRRKKGRRKEKYNFDRKMFVIYCPLCSIIIIITFNGNKEVWKIKPKNQKTENRERNDEGLLSFRASNQFMNPRQFAEPQRHGILSVSLSMGKR
jgi:hypothetical protein